MADFFLKVLDLVVLWKAAVSVLQDQYSRCSHLQITIHGELAQVVGDLRLLCLDGSALLV